VPANLGVCTYRLAIACADGHIRICAQSANDSEPVVQVVSTSATTHQDSITSLAFSGSSAGRYLASTSLDRTCIIWDLGQEDDSAAGSIAFATRFAHPLLSVSAHHKHAEFLVADDSGNIFLFDWAATGRAPVQLVDPRTLADARTGAKAVGIGSAAWKSHDSDCVGAVFGSRWIVWHFTQGAGGGGKPVLSGNTLLDGGSRFRYANSCNMRLISPRPWMVSDGLQLNRHNSLCARHLQHTALSCIS